MEAMDFSWVIQVQVSAIWRWGWRKIITYYHPKLGDDVNFEALLMVDYCWSFWWIGDRLWLGTRRGSRAGSQSHWAGAAAGMGLPMKFSVLGEETFINSLANYFRVPKLVPGFWPKLISLVWLNDDCISVFYVWFHHEPPESLAFILSLPGDQRPVLSCWPGSGNNYRRFPKMGVPQ